MRHIKEIMIVAVCLMVLSFCVCTGFGIYFMYREGVQEYEDLRTYVKETDEDDHTEGTDGSDGKQTVVDFKALKKQAIACFNSVASALFTLVINLLCCR